MSVHEKEKRMNVCLIYPGYPPEENLGGGISTFVTDFSELLKYLNCNVTVVTRSDKNKVIKKEKKNGITIYRIPSDNSFLTESSPLFSFNQFGAIDYTKRLVQLIVEIEKNNKSFDVIEVADWGAEAFYLIQEEGFKNRTIIRCHTPAFIAESYNPSNKEFLSLLVKEMEKYVLLNSKHVLSYSDLLMKSIEKQLKVKISYNLQNFFIQEKGIDVKKVYKSNFSSRKRMKILTVGRIEERKGTDVLIKAVEKMIDRGYQVELDFIGSTTPLKNGYDSVAEWKNYLKNNIKYNNQINFLGFFSHREVKRMYKNYDLFVMASRFESWGLTIVEAIYAKVPVVVSDGCTVSKYLKEGKDCFIFKNKEVYDLVKKMIYVYEKYNEIISVTESAKETVKNKFDPLKETKKIKDYYNKISRL